MKTQKNSKKTFISLLAMVLFSYQSMLAQQTSTAENITPTHSIIFISSAVFFILGFVVLIVLKIRDDAKERKESDEPVSKVVRHHRHPNHYGHRHQYH
ncbi:MAG TPA: hypothetical protein VN698_11435 [Bacteroidia bacterium]|nr:hypothetical protein [Bacteroidia bacterium]